MRLVACVESKFMGKKLLKMEQCLFMTFAIILSSTESLRINSATTDTEAITDSATTDFHSTEVHLSGTGTKISHSFGKTVPHLRMALTKTKHEGPSVICTEEGYNTYPTKDPKKYIQCVKNPWKGRWYFFVYTCPDGTVFDKTLNTCTFDFDSPPPPETVNPCDTRKRLDDDNFDGDEVICP